MSLSIIVLMRECVTEQMVLLTVLSSCDSSQFRYHRSHVRETLFLNLKNGVPVTLKCILFFGNKSNRKRSGKFCKEAKTADNDFHEDTFF